MWYLQCTYIRKILISFTQGTDGPAVSTFASPAKVGWLYKHGGSGISSHWKKRWFIADNHYLFYYKLPNVSHLCTCLSYLAVYMYKYIIYVYIVHPESFRYNAQNAIAFSRRNRPRVHRSGEFACVYLRLRAFPSTV